MREFYNRTGTCKADPATFGGCIYASDFNTDYRGKDTYSSVIAGRILQDQRFDEQCRKNRENHREKCSRRMDFGVKTGTEERRKRFDED